MGDIIATLFMGELFLIQGGIVLVLLRNQGKDDNVFMQCCSWTMYGATFIWMLTNCCWMTSIIKRMLIKIWETGAL